MKTIKNKKIESINSLVKTTCHCLLFFSAGCDFLGVKQAVNQVLSKKDRICQENCNQYQNEDEDTKNEYAKYEPNGIDNEGYERSPKGSEDQGNGPEQVCPSIGSVDIKNHPATPAKDSLGKVETKNKTILDKNNAADKSNKSDKAILNEQNKKVIGTEKNSNKSKSNIDLSENQLSKPAQKETYGFTASTGSLQDISQETRSLDQAPVTLEELDKQISELEAKIAVVNNYTTTLTKEDKTYVGKIKKTYKKSTSFINNNKNSKITEAKKRELLKKMYDEVKAALLALEIILEEQAQKNN